MSAGTVETPAVAGPKANQWAVVCTGFISPDYEVTPIIDGHGRKCPVIVRLFPDRGKAESMMRRLNSRHSKVEMFMDRDWMPTIPIYGLVETNLTASVKRAGNPAANFGRKSGGKRGKAA